MAANTHASVPSIRTFHPPAFKAVVRVSFPRACTDSLTREMGASVQQGTRDRQRTKGQAEEERADSDPWRMYFQPLSARVLRGSLTSPKYVVSLFMTRRGGAKAP